MSEFDESFELPTLFALHYLAGSAKEWSGVFELLPGVACAAVDLPGFGDAAHATQFSVTDMAHYVADRIRRRSPAKWLIAGHSMGAKVACVIARQIADGTLPLAGLQGLVLLAGSPPSPEPMSESSRSRMLAWFRGGDRDSRPDAESYVDDNAGPALNSAWRALAVSDAQRMNPSAWRAWLEHGSREDWADRIGTLATPALILAGEDDQNLGPAAQQALMAPHFPDVSLKTFPMTKHLLPMERPRDVADAIAAHIDRSLSTAAQAPTSFPLLDSSRVSRNTRAALESRARIDAPDYEPRAFSPVLFATLRAVLSRVIPQLHPPHIDIAARIDEALSSATSDGWRFADLPDDETAYNLGLQTLSEFARRNVGGEFTSLDEKNQDELLRAIGEGTVALDASLLDTSHLSAQQMMHWFEDLRADAVREYLGHPATLARMGYSGNAYGGDGEPKSGYVRIGIGEREAWEPIAATDVGHS